MKIKIFNLIMYCLTLAILVFMFIFNRRRVALFFIIAMLLYLACSILIFLPGFRLPKIKAYMETPKQNIDDNNKYIFKISLKNNYFPFCRIDVYLGIKHKLSNIKEKLFFCTSIFHGESIYELDFTFKNCGIYEISHDRVLLHDMLGIFSRKLNIELVQAIVLPNDTDFHFTTSRFTPDDDLQDIADPLAGSDVSEIKELRDYRAGDRLSQIHWKLSTKSEDLIVKEYANNAGVTVAIAADGSYKNPDNMTSYYELLYSFGKNMLKDDIFFQLVYFDSQSEDILSNRIDNMYDLEIAIQNMYFNLVPTDIQELSSLYNYGNEGIKKMLYLTCNNTEIGNSQSLITKNEAKIITLI